MTVAAFPGEPVADGVYYPSVVVNFRLRFDESLQRIVPSETLEVDELVSTRLGISVVSKTDFVPLFMGGPQDAASHLLNIIPKTASIELPTSRQANKFALTLEFKDFPIDPRLISACSVMIHVGTVAPEDFADGMTLFADQSRRRSSILNPYDAAGNPNADTLAMVGTVDEWTVSHEAGVSMIDISGRGLSGILLDSPFPPELLGIIKVGRPIDEVVRQVLSLHPLGATIAPFIKVAPRTDWPNFTIPAPRVSDQAARVGRGASGTKPPRGGSKGAGSLNFWDVITRFCFLVGAIPRFKGQFLEIKPSRGLFDQALRAGIDPAVPTPFKNGAVRFVNGKPIRVRRLVYGRNVEDLTLNRKLGGVKAQVVEVLSLDTSSKLRGKDRVISAIYPGPGDIVGNIRSQVASSGIASVKQTLKIPVNGITDPTRLKEIAKSVFEEIMRGEIGGSFKTKVLSSIGGNNADPDMLRLRPGDALEIGVDASGFGSRPPVVSELTDLTAASFEEAVAKVKARVGDGRLARVIVASTRGSITQLQSIFYTEVVKFDWDASTGIEISGDFKNYVEAQLGPR